MGRPLVPERVADLSGNCARRWSGALSGRRYLRRALEAREAVFRSKPGQRRSHDAAHADSENEDATQEQYEVAEAEESELGLIGKKGQLSVRGGGLPGRIRRAHGGRHADDRHVSGIGVGDEGVQHQPAEHQEDAALCEAGTHGTKYEPEYGERFTEEDRRVLRPGQMMKCSDEVHGLTNSACSQSTRATKGRPDTKAPRGNRMGDEEDWAGPSWLRNRAQVRFRGEGKFLDSVSL